MLFFYLLLGFLLIPIIKINLHIRILKGKEDKIRYLERYGISKINRPFLSNIETNDSVISSISSIPSPSVIAV